MIHFHRFVTIEWYRIADRRAGGGKYRARRCRCGKVKDVQVLARVAS